MKQRIFLFPAYTQTSNFRSKSTATTLFSTRGSASAQPWSAFSSYSTSPLGQSTSMLRILDTLASLENLYNVGDIYLL